MSVFGNLSLNKLSDESAATHKPFGQLHQTECGDSSQQGNTANVEYVNLTLLSGEHTRFNRVWGGHRFTDEEVEGLILGYSVIFDTEHRRGVCGSLDWTTYEEHDYYGFVPWADAAYTIENAPFPKKWNDHVFTPEEEAELRAGHKLLVVCNSKRSGGLYAVHVTFELVTQDEPSNYTSEKRWVIVPHFDEFDKDALDMTREDCLFLPIFSDKLLSLTEIKRLRKGLSVRHRGVSRTGRAYRCYLQLELEEYRGGFRWALVPDF